MLTPYACPKGLVPMPKIDTCAESGFPGTSGCLGMPAVIAGISKLIRGDLGPRALLNAVAAFRLKVNKFFTCRVSTVSFLLLSSRFSQFRRLAGQQRGHLKFSRPLLATQQAWQCRYILFALFLPCTHTVKRINACCCTERRPVPARCYRFLTPRQQTSSSRTPVSSSSCDRAVSSCS